MWLTIPKECEQFCYPRLNRSEEIRRKTVEGGICDRFYFYFDKLQLGVARDVMSSTVLAHGGMDVRGKFGDSRLNSGQIIRLFL